MTREECWKLIYVLKSTYPKTYEKFEEEEFENLCTALFMCLEEYSYDQAANGLKAFIISDTKGFPPVVGQIIEQIHKLGPQYENAIEAWNLVSKAISRGTYYAEEEFEKLPELVKKTIGSSRFLYDEATNPDYNVDVCKGQFMKVYEAVVKREQEIAKLPVSMRLEVRQPLQIEGGAHDDSGETPES